MPFQMMEVFASASVPIDDILPPLDMILTVLLGVSMGQLTRRMRSSWAARLVVLLRVRAVRTAVATGQWG